VEPLAFSDILNWPDDTGLNITSDPKWDTAQSPWLNVSYNIRICFNYAEIKDLTCYITT